MAVERTRDFKIWPGAYRAWENQVVPRRIEEVVDAAFALPSASTRCYKVVPIKDLWCLEGIVFGCHVKIFGNANEHGQWSCVREVHANGR